MALVFVMQSVITNEVTKSGVLSAIVNTCETMSLNNSEKLNSLSHSPNTFTSCVNRQTNCQNVGLFRFWSLNLMN